MIALTLILIAAVALLVSQTLRYELTALLIIFALPAAGILTPAEAISGFANEATITVAAMFVLSAGLAKTGAVDYVAGLATSVPNRDPKILLLIIAGLAAIPSAFLNNTAVVIMLIPVVLRICQKTQVLPSKLMIPLSYFAILGGTLTLVGTSTNILVHSLFIQAGGDGFGMFEFTPMGLCYLVLGGAFILIFANRMLPERKVLSQLLERQHRSRFVTEIILPDKSRLSSDNLGGLIDGIEDVRILELVRGEDVLLGPPDNTEVETGDTLLIEGTPRGIHTLLERQGVDLASAVADTQRVRISRMNLQVVEAVVTPNSPFFNLRLSEVGLNRLYGIKVLAIQRMGRHLHERLRELKLQVGDVLLIQGEESALYELQTTGNVLLVEGVERTLRFPKNAPIAFMIMILVVVGATSGWMPLSVLAIGGAALMMLVRCLRVREAFRAMDSSVLLLIAATIPLGIAMQKTGMAEVLAQGVIGFADNFGPTMLIGVVYLITSVFSAFLTNIATAVLLTPIVLEISNEMGIDPRPLLVAVAFGASACFATPIGYQTNLLVMGPGGYFFRDYLRIGLALNLILWLAAMFLIPIFWPI
jgi:di/tricarboxylate transporter